MYASCHTSRLFFCQQPNPEIGFDCIVCRFDSIVNLPLQCLVIPCYLIELSQVVHSDEDNVYDLINALLFLLADVVRWL